MHLNHNPIIRIKFHAVSVPVLVLLRHILPIFLALTLLYNHSGRNNYRVSFVLPLYVIIDNSHSTSTRNLNINTVIGVEYTFIKEIFITLRVLIKIINCLVEKAHTGFTYSFT
jgi:hypothetical protein